MLTTVIISRENLSLKDMLKGICDTGDMCYVR